MKIKINREALNIVKNYENVTIEYSNGGDTYRLSNGDLLTRNEIKKLTDINLVDEVLEQIKAKENDCEYVDESGNYITAEEFNKLNEQFDDIEDEYEKIEWEELWYAAMRDRDDNDWGYGSYVLEEAIEMADKNNHPSAYIAVIENDVCIKEIEL